MLRSEQLDEFRSQKEPLQRDMMEAVLLRLTSPSTRIAEALETDPQVKSAVRLAADSKRYEAVIAPPKGERPVSARVAPRRAVRVFPGGKLPSDIEIEPGSTQKLGPSGSVRPRGGPRAFA